MRWDLSGGVAEHGQGPGRISDNGPGIDVAAIKRNLVSAEERRDAESTQLGLRVTLHLLEKCGGQLFALNKTGAGAAFILEFSQQPPGPR
jgi:K+-sensing histidine kinase KdpD